MGLEPTAYALEGHCSFHLRYIPMCVSISCMPTFKALTQRNTYGYFYFCRASASYLLVWSDQTTYANFMSAMAVRDFNVFTDNPRIKTYNGIPQKPGYHKPVKPSRALRRLLTAFRYEGKGVFHVDGIFADCKDRKKKTSAKQDYQDSDLGMQQSKCCALPLGDSPKLRERDHLLPDYFRETPYIALSKKLSRLCTVLCKTLCCRTHYSIFVSHTQASYTLDALISLPHIQCQHNNRYSAITMAL